MNRCLLSELSILKIEGEDVNKFLHKLSASNLEEDCSYLFFLNENGRYIADCFFISSKQLIIATNNILIRLENYLKKMDLRKKYKFSRANETISYSMKSGEYNDPRIPEGYINITNNISESIENSQDFYKKLRLENEIAEFEDFIENKSIIANYGAISKFISKTKGCYPGQELMARFNIIQPQKTVIKIDELDGKELQILLKIDNQYLLYKKI